MDQWAVSTVLQGHFWKFRSRPPPFSFQPTKIPTSREKEALQYIQILLYQQAVVLVPDSENHSGFYSPEVEGLEARAGPEKAEQVHSCGALQDGVPKHSNINRYNQEIGWSL